MHFMSTKQVFLESLDQNLKLSVRISVELSVHISVNPLISLVIYINYITFAIVSALVMSIKRLFIVMNCSKMASIRKFCVVNDQRFSYSEQKLLMDRLGVKTW